MDNSQSQDKQAGLWYLYRQPGYRANHQEDLADAAAALAGPQGSPAGPTSGDTPRVITDPHELRAAREALEGSVALVMTMGALHAGHLALVERARELADHVIVSIYVNPLQFGPGEDYQDYPRTLDADCQLLAKAGVDLVFAPTDEQMYPGWPTRPLITFNPGPGAANFEGAARPTHFAGVLQVVAKVIALVRADWAVFGQKDAQQLALVKTLVRELWLPTEIVSVPIARADDAVALSSRNAYLSDDERVQARALSAALKAGARAADQGEAADVVVQKTSQVLRDAGLNPDYVAVVSAETFLPLAAQGGLSAGHSADHSAGQAASADNGLSSGEQAVIIVAARVGSTRLIDNQLIDLKGKDA